MRRAGLTLVELLVVLAILAVLTTVAVSLTDTVLEQARYETTQRQLENIETAILGPMNPAEGLVGFLADVGRPPLAVGADPATQLAELWENPRLLPGFGLALGSDPEVRLLAGWRGPYLRLPPQTGTRRLLDGWGNPFDLLLNNGITPAGPDAAIGIVRSPGGPTPPYDVPLFTTRPLVEPTVPVTGTVVDSDPATPATTPVTVKLFFPVVLPGAGAAALGEKTITISPGASLGFTFFNDGTVDNSVPIGARALRAYQADGAGTIFKSNIVYVRVPPGGLTMTQPLVLDLK